MLQTIVWIFHLCLVRWNPAKPTLEEIIPQVNCFVSVRYLLALHHLSKIAPEAAENGVPAEMVLAVLKPNFPELSLENLIQVLKSTDYILMGKNGFLLNRQKIQQKMFDCHTCRRQVTLGQDGCQNPDCPTNKGAKS